ncbi:MAG: zf-HC2 domain-containing protein [Clostridiales bacterium]|nr:zf-HC2 domain-containing protein [Clostridiales bacterium]
MTCMKAQGLITAFINDELNIGELEEFVSHMQACEECREELEVYYALLTAMKQLDEDRNLSDDFNQELKEKLDRAQERIIHLRYNYYRKKGVMLLIIISMTVLFSLYHYFTPKDIGNPVKESRFKLRFSFMEDRFEGPTEELNRYLEELKNKAVETAE